MKNIALLAFFMVGAYIAYFLYTFASIRELANTIEDQTRIMECRPYCRIHKVTGRALPKRCEGICK